MASLTRYELICDETVVHIFCYQDDAYARIRINEGHQRGSILLKGAYSAQYHQSHISPYDQNHLHVYKRNNEIFAINFDGTAHHRHNRGVPIPNKVYTAIAKIFPNIPLPKSGILESVDAHQVFLDETIRGLLEHLKPKRN